VIKNVCAVLINGKDDVLVFHRKNTEMINQNWCLPGWDFDQAGALSPKEYLEKKLQNDFKIIFLKFITEKQIEQTIFVVFKIENLNASCAGDDYDQIEFRPWEIVRDYTDDQFFQIYNKLFVKIKKHLESPYKRYVRILFKLVAALILFLLPFAVLWKFFKIS